MGLKREIVGVVFPYHVKDVKISVPYDLGRENYWNPSSYVECDKAYYYIGSHKDIELL